LFAILNDFLLVISLRLNPHLLQLNQSLSWPIIALDKCLDSPFSNFTEEIICKHQIIQAEFEEMNKKMNILFLKTSEWNVIFESAKEQLKLREEKRKIYDHYEEKLSKINKSNKKDQKYIERNEGKYSKAASEYVDISEKAFNTINNSLKIAYELTNTMIDEIITSEKIIYRYFSNDIWIIYMSFIILLFISSSYN